MIAKTFDESHLTPETIQRLRHGELILESVSSKLYALKVPEDASSFPNSALDHWNGCALQDLFNDESY